jgi:hypothetical protein
VANNVRDTILKAISWFKSTFGDRIKQATQGTPFTVDMLTAIAMQEAYYIWGNLYNTSPEDEVLALCVGDTLDAPRRSAFPRNRLELVNWRPPSGNQIFDVARAALVAVGQHNAQYGEIAHMNPNKFCHGFGIFQYDIQFCKTNSAYFVQKQWADFDQCLTVCLSELKAPLKRAYGPNKTALTDMEMAFVAIAYNAGSVNTAKGLKQGYKDDSGKYYGEHFWEYLQLAHASP